MDLHRRRIEWHILKGLCRGLSDPAWEPLWDGAAWLRPEDFSHADLGKVFNVLRSFRRERQNLRVSDDELAAALRAELGWQGLGGFSVECLLSPSPTDPETAALREGIQMLLGAPSRL